MGRTYPEITPELKAWIEAQSLFFVATAPLSPTGSINCSPKGLDTFRVISPKEVIYLDLTGSGIETIAHLQENGRIVVMFCAFTGSPQILRIHGQGTVYLPGTPEFQGWVGLFPDLPGKRAIIHIQATRISTSCGYGVPQMALVTDRATLTEWATKKGEAGLATYRAQKNRLSVDNLPGLGSDSSTLA